MTIDKDENCKIIDAVYQKIMILIIHNYICQKQC